MTEEEKYVRLSNLLLIQHARNGLQLVESSGAADYPGLVLTGRILDRLMKREKAAIDGAGHEQS